MAKFKLSISLDEQLIAKLGAIQKLEMRPSLSNTIEACLNFDKYNFLEVTDQASGIKFIANPIHANPFAWSNQCEHDWACSADTNHPNITHVCLKCNAKIYGEE